MKMGKNFSELREALRSGKKRPFSLKRLWHTRHQKIHTLKMNIRSWLGKKINGWGVHGNVLYIDRLPSECYSEDMILLYTAFHILEHAIRYDNNLNYAYKQGKAKLEDYLAGPECDKDSDELIKMYKKIVKDENTLLGLYDWWLKYIDRMDDYWKRQDQATTDYLNNKITSGEYMVVENELTALEDEATKKLMKLCSLRSYLCI